MRQRNWRLAVVGVIVVIGAMSLVLVLRTGGPVHAVGSSSASNQGDAFVFRLEPDGDGFVFTYTLPVDGADPQDVLVVPASQGVDVWLAETGAHRIGRLTYTDSDQYEYRAYQLADGSEPLNLIAHQGFIWFTAAGVDAIGRLDPDSGDIDTFDVGAGTYPADLTAGPNGNIWFTQMMADQLAELVITSTVDYDVRGYTDALLSGGRPFGVAVSAGSLYVAQTANDIISIFTPPDSWLHMPPTGLPEALDEPYKLVTDGQGRVWGTERAGNHVSRYGFGSFPEIARYPLSPAGSAPTGIAADAQDDIWFTQHRAGQVGRLRPAAAAHEMLTYYPLPQPGLAPTGVSADDAGAIWVVASRAYRIYLPIVVRRTS